LAGPSDQWRANQRAGWAGPTAAVMRRTWRLRLSRKLQLKPAGGHGKGRCRIGGAAQQRRDRRAWGGLRRQGALPLHDHPHCAAAADGSGVDRCPPLKPHSGASWNPAGQFGEPFACRGRSCVSSNRPSLSASRRPAGIDAGDIQLKRSEAGPGNCRVSGVKLGLKPPLGLLKTAQNGQRRCINWGCCSGALPEVHHPDRDSTADVDPAIGRSDQKKASGEG